MELRDALGAELFSQVEARLNEINGADDRKDNPVRFVDLSEGNYVGKENHTRLQTECSGYKNQLKEANDTIKSYKDMDIDGIKQSAANWETKYNQDTKKLQDQLDAQQRTFAAERYLDTFKIKSPLSRKTILQDFMDQKLELKNGSFVGADEYMKKIKEQYPDEFESDDPEEPPKRFVRGTTGTHRPKTKNEQESYLESKYGKNKYFQK